MEGMQEKNWEENSAGKENSGAEENNEIKEEAAAMEEKSCGEESESRTESGDAEESGITEESGGMQNNRPQEVSTPTAGSGVVAESNSVGETAGAEENNYAQEKQRLKKIWIGTLAVIGIVVVALIAFLLLTGRKTGVKNDVESFRGVTWDMNIEEVIEHEKKLGNTTEPDRVEQYVSGFGNCIGIAYAVQEENTYAVAYTFDAETLELIFMGKFVAYKWDLQTFYEIKDELIEEYGQPTQDRSLQNPPSCTWQLESTRIYLSQTVVGTGYAIYRRQ